MENINVVIGPSAAVKKTPRTPKSSVAGPDRKAPSIPPSDVAIHDKDCRSFGPLMGSSLEISTTLASITTSITATDRLCSMSMSTAMAGVVTRSGTAIVRDAAVCRTLHSIM